MSSSDSSRPGILGCLVFPLLLADGFLLVSVWLIWIPHLGIVLHLVCFGLLVFLGLCLLRVGLAGCSYCLFFSFSASSGFSRSSVRVSTSDCGSLEEDREGSDLGGSCIGWLWLAESGGDVGPCAAGGWLPGSPGFSAFPGFPPSPGFPAGFSPEFCPAALLVAGLACPGSVVRVPTGRWIASPGCPLLYFRRNPKALSPWSRLPLAWHSKHRPSSSHHCVSTRSSKDCRPDSWRRRSNPPWTGHLSATGADLGRRAGVRSQTDSVSPPACPPVWCRSPLRPVCLDSPGLLVRSIVASLAPRFSCFSASRRLVGLIVIVGVA